MKKEQFNFLDTKIVKGCIVTNYEIIGDANPESISKQKDNCQVPPSEDYVQAIRAFDGFLTDVFMIKEDHHHKIKTNGIAIRKKTSDDGISTSVCIKGLLTTKSGSVRSITTDFISENGQAYGWEESITEMAQKVIDETFSYVTRKKKGSPTTLDDYVSNGQGAEYIDDEQPTTEDE